MHFAGAIAAALAIAGIASTGCTALTDSNAKLVEPTRTAERPRSAGRPKVALVLGAGGTRGFAHIGVIKALEAAGIEPDLVVGSSAGSIVGALYAAGLSGASLEQLALEFDPSALIDVSLLDGGKVRGVALETFVNERLGGRPIEQLPREFAAVATRAVDGSMAIFNRGNPGLAVRASSAMRWRFLPVRIRGEDYLDGVEVSPVPIRAARALGADVVIAVNVIARRGRMTSSTRWRGYHEYRLRLVEDEAAGADVLIHPDTGESSSMSTSYRRAVIAAAESATREELTHIRVAIAAKSRVMRGVSDARRASGRGA